METKLLSVFWSNMAQMFPMICEWTTCSLIFKVMGQRSSSLKNVGCAGMLYVALSGFEIFQASHTAYRSLLAFEINIIYHHIVGGTREFHLSVQDL